MKLRGLDSPPHLTPQKDSSKDPGISGEDLRPSVEPELRPEGRRSLRLGVRRRESRFWRAGPPTTRRALLTCLLAFPCRLCSPECLRLPPPQQKDPLQRSAPRGLERGRGTRPSCRVSKDLLGSLREHHGWPTTLGTAAVSLSAVTDSLRLGSHCPRLIP